MISWEHNFYYGQDTIEIYDMKFCHQMSQNWHMTEPYVHAAYLNLWQWINFLLVVVAVEAAIFTIRSTCSFYNSGRMLSCVCQLGTGADSASDYILDRWVEHVCRCSWCVRPLANREQQSRWAMAPKNCHYGDSKEGHPISETYDFWYSLVRPLHRL